MSYRKYNNQPVEIDGYHFDSKMEASRYQELLLLVAAGTVIELCIHPCFELQPAFVSREGKKVRALIYEADFSYMELRKLEDNDLRSFVTFRSVVEDVKGHRTAEFRIKQKIFWYRYPHLELRIVEG